MKKLSIALLATLLSLSAVAGPNKIQQQGFKSQADCIAAGVSLANCLLLTAQVWDSTNGTSLDQSIANGTIGGGGGGGGGLNLLALKDQSFEQATTGWTSTGGTAAVSSASPAPLYGAQSLLFTATGSAQTAQSPLLTVPAGLYGKNGAGYCTIATSSSDMTLRVLDGSSNVLNTVAVPAAASGGPYPVVPLTFIFPSTGTPQVRLQMVAGSSETAVLDSCYLGDANGTLIQNVSQASQYATLTTSAANAQWMLTSTSFSDFPTISAVTYSVTGNCVAPSTNEPWITCNNMPPGNYYVVARGAFNVNANTDNQFRLSDGTINSPGQGSDGNGGGSPVIVGSFNYTTAGNRTIKIQAYSASSFVAISSGTSSAPGVSPLTIEIYRFPSASQLAITPSTQSGSWSGAQSGCNWQTTSATYTSALTLASGACTATQETNQNFGTVTLSTTLPQVTLTPNKVGAFQVCSTVNGLFNSSSGGQQAAQVTDGTTVLGTLYSDGNNSHTKTTCKNYTVTSLSPITFQWQVMDIAGGTAGLSNNIAGVNSVEWSIIDISQNLPTPILVGSVSSNTSGAAHIDSGTVVCSSGSSISSQSGSWISSIGNIASSGCVLTLAIGEFSSTPWSCWGNIQAGSAQTTVLTFNPTSSTSVTVYGSGSPSSFTANVACMGPR